VTRIYQFIKTTLIGGVLFLAPLIVILYLVGKAVALLSRVMERHPTEC
jgi:uncharacterized membrane protein